MTATGIRALLGTTMDTATPLLDYITDESVEHSLSDSLRTTLALFFHTRNARLEMMTAHPVRTTSKGQVLVESGRLLTPEDERMILDLMHGRKTDSSGIRGAANSPDVLYREHELLVWWLPPIEREMHLKSDKHGYSKVTTVWPSIVAAVAGRTLYLSACAGQERPDQDSPLFHAPLGNIYANTAVCTGSAKVPAGATMADKASWEDLIFETAFTHVNHPNTLATGKTQRTDADADFWRNRRGKDTLFPDDLLQPLGTTLGQWVTAILEGEME